MARRNGKEIGLCHFLAKNSAVQPIKIPKDNELEFGVHAVSDRKCHKLGKFR